MPRLTLFDLLGSADVHAAARRWPRSAFLPGPGVSAGGEEASDYEPLLAYLNTVLSFHAVRPGAAAARVGLHAEVVIEPHPQPEPFVLRTLPDLAFTLQPNSAASPARVFLTQADTGVELVVEALPVEILLPHGLIGPLRPEAEELQGPPLGDTRIGALFESGVLDSLEVRLSEVGPSAIRVHVRVRLTEEQEVVLEPAVPLSFGPCRFSGLPCRGVHDLGLVPYPTLSGDHTEHEQALEWVRHLPHGGFDGTGLVTVRTLDLDHDRDPIRQLRERFDSDSAAAGLEFVLEDLALPVFAWLSPVPTHGRFGLRRAVLQGGDEIEAYDLTQAPVEISLSALVDWRLRIFRLLFETPDTVVARMAVLFGTDAAEDHALVIDVSDGWLLQGAWLPPEPLELLTIANATLSLMTAKVGILLRDLQDAQGVSGWGEHLRALVDLGIKLGDGAGATFQVVAGGPAPAPGSDLGQKVVLRDLGWDLGEVRVVPSLWFPEGLKLTAFEVVQLEVEELDFVNEDNGGRYVAFSGGISIFPGAGDPERKPRQLGTPGVPAEGSPDGGGLRFRRLRLRTGGNPEAPRWLLDGIGLFLRVGRFEVSGSGSITDTTRDGHRYREFALAILLAFRAMGKDFSIGAQLVYGRVTGPVDEFTYWMFGLQLGYLPVTSFELRGVSVLVAGGMVPALPAPSGRPQEMRLLEWYRAHQSAGAVEVRSDRSAARGGWQISRGAQAAGVGADLGLAATKQVTLRVFIFFHRSDADTGSSAGFLVAAEVFLLKATQPVGLGAIEVDLERDRWAALVAVDLDFAQLLDTDSALARGLARLTGTMFAGNQPGQFAIGQLADPASWLTLASDKTLLGLRGRLSVAFCLQVSARPGPRGAGLAVTAAASGSMGVGRVEVYASFGLLVGTWANEASSSGVVVWAELALRIKVFYVFSFGASVKGVFEQLGPQEPNYRRFSLEVRIETPWWLPDVTFRVIRVREVPQPERMPVLSAPLSTAAALQPGAGTATPAAVTALGPEGAVLAIVDLRALPSAPVPDSAWEELTPVSVRSVIALDLAVAVDNDTTVVPTTPPGAGRQAATPPASNDLTSTYTLVRVGIRRRPRYGPQAGVWTDLLAPEDTEVGGLADLGAGPDLIARFTSDVTFRWDADVLVGGVIDPRRLLINADTPYTFLTANPAAEEELLARDPSFPCCPVKREIPRHTLDFTDVPLGRRSPVSKRFTESASVLRWTLPRSPVVAPALGPPSGEPVARMLLRLGVDLTVAAITLDEPAFDIDLRVFWRPVDLPAIPTLLVVEAMRGLEVVDRQEFPMFGSPPPGGLIRCQDLAGLTAVTLRHVTLAGASPAPSATAPVRTTFLELRGASYRTVREARAVLAALARCQAGGGQAGGGALAWLPNHDYEITMAVREVVDHQGSAQEAVVEQRAGFRTRGLPGLNAVETVGEELEPLVESVYPGVHGLLYRSEPLVVAFDERFSSLVPLDLPSAPDAPAERAQLLEYALAVEQADGVRLSVTAADWVVAHRVAPPRPRRPWVADASLVRAEVRRADSTDPLVQRLERLERLSPACDRPDVQLRSSQVLRHAPVDLTADPGDPDALWPPRISLRVAVRNRGGPHVGRAPFEDGDETALAVADEDLTSATPWTVRDGALGVSGRPAVGRRHYAVLGESGGAWDHVTIRASVAPAGGLAGVAVAVGGLPRVDRALLALVDEAGGRLVVQTRRAGVTTEVGSEALPPSAASYPLEVTAFDDVVRARVGDVHLDVERGDLRGGRVAVVVDGAGEVAELHVDAVDAHASWAETSRYATFQEHVASWDGVTRSVPGDLTAVPGLLAATGPAVADVMAAPGDGQLRQRLFDAWVSGLVLPLATEVDRLRISDVEAEPTSGAQVLLLESPEPLPLSRDVSLRMTHEVTGPVAPPPRGVGPGLVAFAAGLSFRRVRGGGLVRGGVADEVLSTVEDAVRLVHSVRVQRPLPRTEFHVYDVGVTRGPRGAVLEGRLVEVLTRPPFRGPRPVRMPVDHVALFDRRGEVIVNVIPLSSRRTETVSLTVLTNAAEDRALLVAPTPLAPDTYTLHLDLDRARYRAALADAESRYRASAQLTLDL